MPMLILLVLGSVALVSVGTGNLAQHFAYTGLAVFLFLIFSKIDLPALRPLLPLFYLACLVLLTFTLFFGTEVRGAARWVGLGPVVFQPSEVVKPVLLLFWASIGAKVLDIKSFLLLSASLVVPFVLVFAQPDLGSSLVLLAGFAGILFVAAEPIWLLVLGGAGLPALLPVAWALLAPYQRQRIISFLSPAADPLGAGYNSIQAVIAVGSGGFWGRGLGQGTQSQLAFLPERHTDFIFASLGEELGFLASILILVCFAVIFLRIISVLQGPNDRFSAGFLGGVFFVLFTHVIVNVGMNLGLLPITGIPLPFVSSGGSALVSFSAMLGMVSAVSSRLKRAGA